jgi:predicted Zn-dependent protease
MSDWDPEGSLHARYERLQQRLGAAEPALPAAERDRLRSDIVALFRDAERAIAEMTEFKERIRTLVQRFKSLPAPAAAPRIDRLGSSTYLERGWSELAAGEHEAAVSTLRRAVELAPGDSAAELMLGWALMRTAEYDEALVLLQRVLAHDPANLLARANLGYICLKKQIFGEAVEHLSRVLRQAADRKATLYANFYMGLLYLEREMYGDAKSFLAEALEQGPNFTEAWWELGRACYLEGSAADASRAWRRGAEAGRYNVWGRWCTEALERLDAGEAAAAV